MWDGTEWDRVSSGPNETVGFTTSPAASYNLSTEGSATTVTIAATDPEGFPVTYGHVTNPSNQAQATISQSGVHLQSLLVQIALTQEILALNSQQQTECM